MSNRSFIASFEAWSARREPLTLVTVYQTDGSTYSKPGTRMIISGDGEHAGLISGGCLETDLLEHAAEVMGSGTPRAVDYDMRDEDDELFGTGTGCRGLIRVLLQPVTPENGYAPLAQLVDAWQAMAPSGTALVISSTTESLPAGQLVTDAEDGSPLTAGARSIVTESVARLVQESVPGGKCQVLYSRVEPVTRLLLLGAGPDAIPVAGLADDLGWYVTVADHRPAYLAHFTDMDTREVRPEALDNYLNINDFHAILIMSHHLDADRSYLQCVARNPPAYVGLLGPAERRQRLLQDLEKQADEFQLHGPVGLDLGGRQPQSVALSAVAEIHATLMGGSGRPLGQPLP